MTIALISHPDCLLHDMGAGHPEQPARLTVIMEALQKLPQITYFEAPLAERQHLLLAHDEEYVDGIMAIAPSTGLVTLDPDTAMNRYTLRAALLAAGAGIKGVDLVLDGTVQAAFCNVRPPGHHAERHRAMGFCFFNNVVIAALYALEKHGLKRVAIIDFDVHHGNGTEDIIKDDKRVLFCSSFEHPFYPFSGADTECENIINVPLQEGADGARFRAQVLMHWLNKIEVFKPELIFFSAGFDAYKNDRMADLNFLAEDYAWVTAEIRKIAEKTCQGRMVSMLEGGYSLTGLAECVKVHVENLT